MRIPKPVPVQRSTSYGGSFVGGGGTAAVPRSARPWARSAHLHEVRRARHHHHHHHHQQHNHNNIHSGTDTGTDSSGTGEIADVFAAAQSRGSHHHIQSAAPVADPGYFGTDDSDALVRMWMRGRTQVGERVGRDEGGAGTDTWIDTDTEADVDASTGADDDSAFGLWPGDEEIEIE